MQVGRFESASGHAEVSGAQDYQWTSESRPAPLAHGTPARVLRLRGYGDAINAQVAKTFIEAYCETREQPPSTLVEGLLMEEER